MPLAFDDRTANAVFRVLEPYEGKPSRTVLRGQGRGNPPALPDHTGLVISGSLNCGETFR